MLLDREERAEVVIAAREGGILGSEALVEAAAAGLPSDRRTIKNVLALQLQADVELAASGEAEALRSYLLALASHATGRGRERLDALLRRRFGRGAPPPLKTSLELPELAVFADDTVPVAFLERGLAASHSVACAAVPVYEGGAAKGGTPACGTAWVLTPKHVVTCAHVVHGRAMGEKASAADFEVQGKNARVHFRWAGFDDHDEGLAAAAVVAWDDELDVAVLEVRAGLPEPLACSVAPIRKPESDVTASYVNIVQHPGGGGKRVGLRANSLLDVTETELFYFTDTAGGSSGAPVCDDEWRVVGVHRASVPRPGIKFMGRTVGYVNAGRRITTVLEWLAKVAPEVRKAVREG
jgi:V8-like Glu-specific endopeptidase